MCIYIGNGMTYDWILQHRVGLLPKCTRQDSRRRINSGVGGCARRENNVQYYILNNCIIL